MDILQIIIEKIKDFKNGLIEEKELIEVLKNFPYSKDRDIKLDFQRKVRRGIPEVIFGKGKNVSQLRKIIAKISELKQNLIISRVSEEKYLYLKNDFKNLCYHKPARIVTFDTEPEVLFEGKVLIVSAGASDFEVAEEAYVSARYLGNNVEKEYDVGIACISRILDLKERFDSASVIIAVAGMEGAMPSVIAGLTSTPIIGVPTSVGYGANFKGLSALIAMLNSCSGGISVVNIDNGFGAAYQATLINQKIQKK